MKKHFAILYLGISCMISAQSSVQNYTIKLYVGDQIEEMLTCLARWRLTFFHEYPYLYDGNFSEEYEYCKTWQGYKDAALLIAYNDGQPIGLLTGSSLEAFSNHFGNPDDFKAMNIDTRTLYYFGEGIVLPEYRKHGLGARLYAELEKWVIARGYITGCFVSESHEKHPLKPQSYKEHDSLWRALGYEKTNINAQYTWNTIQADGLSREQLHVLPYWVKTFDIKS